jgi:HK97 family phage prohead protease
MASKKGELQRKSISLEVKSVGDDGTFTGYGSVFGNVDSYGDIIQPGAFQKTLGERGDKVALLWQHDSTQPIGVYTSLSEDDHGLFVTGKFALDVQKGAEAYSLLKMGALNGLSIGFSTVRESYDNQTGIRYLQELKLYEISLVTFPANEAATVTSVRSEFKDLFDSLTQEDRVKVISYINNLKQSPQDTGTPLVKDEHLPELDADTKQSDEPFSQEVKHSLEQLMKALKTQ